MRLSKNGFTLAEVLVAMAIVGVIAVSTVPMLTKQTQKTQVGPTLGRAIEQIEIGCRNVIELINDKNEDTGVGYLLSDFSASDLVSTKQGSLAENFVELSAGYSGLDPIPDSFSITPKKFNGDEAEETDETAISNSKKYVFKKVKASTYVIQESVSDSTPNTKIATYYIDTNGKDMPNAFGKDLFIFELQNDCRMVPYNSGTCGGSDSDGKGCAKEIVRNKFKVTYY